MDPNWRETIDSFGLEAAAEIAAFERELPPALVERILGLYARVDDNAASRMQHTLDTERARVLAHFGPDLARLYAIVAHHLDTDGLPSCTTIRVGAGEPREVCTLPPLDPWAHPEVIR
jgi:hypothetical protein